MPDLDRFLDALSSGDPVPGGGGVAALEVALGASLLAMVCELTAGRQKFAGVADQVAEISGQATTCRDRARRLIDIDTEAYGAVAAAMALPRSTEAEKAARREAIQSALQGAARPPLDTMRVAAEAMELARRLVEIGNPNAISDTGSAALALQAGYHSARLNVEINLAGIKDTAFHEAIRQEMSGLPDVDALCAEILPKVEAAISGGG